LPGGTITLAGFPTAYTPDSTYLLNLGHTSGASIKNFNASCRVGTGTATAGIISAGTGTATYGIPAEPNGIHLSQIDQHTATFFWTAPSAGTGTVRFYLAGHQGARFTGPNTNLVLIATEAEIELPPGPVTNPMPPDMASDVNLAAELRWTSAPNADVYEVYFGTNLNPPFISSQIELHIDPGELLPNTDYFWRVVAVNDAGSTDSGVWQFRTQQISPAISDGAAIVRRAELRAAFPNPFNADVTIPFALPNEQQLQLAVYDVLGRRVSLLAEGIFAAGDHAVTWHSDGQGTGIYFVKLETESGVLYQKIVALK
jgi:hypothetical protein